MMIALRRKSLAPLVEFFAQGRDEMGCVAELVDHTLDPFGKARFLHDVMQKAAAGRSPDDARSPAFGPTCSSRGESQL